MREIKLKNQTTLDSITDEVQSDDYKSRLLKLIPTEVVGAFIAIDSILKSNIEQLQTMNIFQTLSWIIFFILFIITPFYLKKFMNVSNNSQLILSTIAFPVWVLTIGGPFLFILGN